MKNYDDIFPNLNRPRPRIEKVTSPGGITSRAYIFDYKEINLLVILHSVETEKYRENVYLVQTMNGRFDDPSPKNNNIYFENMLTPATHARLNELVGYFRELQ
jgi:hypothetical protein